jgi:hypothetical protein
MGRVNAFGVSLYTLMMTSSHVLPLVRAAILDEDSFVRASFSGRQRGQEQPWLKVQIRPVELKGDRHLQFSFFDEKKNLVENQAGSAAREQLEIVLALPFRNFHVLSINEDLQINLSKKGKVLLKRQPLEQARRADTGHDRQKNTLLSEGQDIPFLRATGIMRQDRKIAANRRSKFQQINAFLKILNEVPELAELPEPVRVVDFGSGNAYLTFAAAHYLQALLGKSAAITGVDIQEPLNKRNQALAVDMGWPDLRFETGWIQDHDPEAPPHIVTALHACDTATDEAIAQGIRWGAELIVAAPCCHHDLQAQLKQQETPPAFAPVMRYGLLHERLGDVLTDALRALILRMLGYQVTVIQFVAPEHTPKNLLLRAVRKTEPGSEQALKEYRQLRDFWSVSPYLEKLLSEELRLIGLPIPSLLP